MCKRLSLDLGVVVNMALQRYEVALTDIWDFPDNWQLPTGVTISGVSSTVSPAGPTVSGSAPDSDTSQTRFTASGGAAGTLYTVSEVVTFSNGEKRTPQFEVFIRT